MKLFDRRASLVVDRLVVDGLRFTFAVEQSLSSTPNKAEIHIFNLNEQHRQQLAGLSSVSCDLVAGYVERTFSVFRGDLEKAVSMYDGSTWDTAIKSADGGKVSREKRVAKGYRPGTTVETVMRDLAQSLGLGVGNLSEALQSARLSQAGLAFVGGTVLEGSAASELEQLTATCGLEYSIQSGVLQFLPLGRGLGGQPIVLAADTGLVGDVEKDAKTGKIKGKHLIAPDLVPGRKVRPQTRTADGGDYRITKRTVRGDTHGTEWYVEFEAEPERVSARRAQDAEFRRIRDEERRRRGIT